MLLSVLVKYDVGSQGMVAGVSSPLNADGHYSAHAE